MEISKEVRAGVKPAAWGAAAGAIGIMILGSYWPGWVLESTAAKRLQEGTKAALVQTLAPVCAAKFRLQPNAGERYAALETTSYWQRGAELVKLEFVAPSGVSNIDEATGEACFSLLSDLAKKK